ncbi:MAG: AraC family transcriptional regulator [Ruminococcus sp.]|nr:AraC family transcriptional regulator [Ruminococcus sp.]
MSYKYEIINLNRNIPAKIMNLHLSSETHKTELHWHREPELVYIIEGAAECPCNGETHIAYKNSLVFFNSDDVHLVKPVNGTEAKLLCVQLSYEYMRLFCSSVENISFNLDLTYDAKNKLTELMAEFSQLDEISDEFATLMQLSYINKIYYILFKHCIVIKDNKINSFIPNRDFSYAKTAIEYINENYKREITLNEISSLVNLSPSYFSKYFKGATQVGFSDYLANLRLEYAIQDMVHKNSTVSQAAMENGFANVKSFIAQCKRVYNCTPAKYKKKLLNE